MHAEVVQFVSDNQRLLCLLLLSAVLHRILMLVAAESLYS